MEERMSNPVNSIGWQDVNQTSTQSASQTSESKKKDSEHDSVTLSIGARVHQLKEEGKSIQTISTDLGISSSQVMEYLGVSTAYQSSIGTTTSTKS
jgi:hypothetical protein